MFPKQRSDLVTQFIDNEVIILDNRANQINQLNDTAAFIWQRCDGTKSQNEIVEQLLQHFDVDRDTARRDVESILNLLTTSNLLRM